MRCFHSLWLLVFTAWPGLLIISLYLDTATALADILGRLAQRQATSIIIPELLKKSEGDFVISSVRLSICYHII